MMRGRVPAALILGLALLLVLVGASAASLTVEGGTLQTFVLDPRADLGRTAITAAVDIEPDRLVTKERGAPVTAIIELPAEAGRTFVDPSTVRLCIGVDLCEAHSVAADRPRWGDADHDSRPDLLVRFARPEVIALVPDVTAPTLMPFTVSGSAGARTFLGSDTVDLFPPTAGAATAPSPTPSSTDPSVAGPSRSGVPSPSAEPSSSPGPSIDPSPPASMSAPPPPDVSPTPSGATASPASPEVSPSPEAP